ncbi:hypothetical protein BDR26DRAFT_717868 [Obelidium mucronatum]|nr:hypothetical protein BDR26DRAFT_717868 [Obelidium mucronatum]
MLLFHELSCQKDYHSSFAGPMVSIKTIDLDRFGLKKKLFENRSLGPTVVQPSKMNDPALFPNLVLYLPTFILGILLNGIVMYTMLRRDLLRLNLEKIICALLCVNLLWALTSSIHLLLPIFLQESDTFNQIKMIQRSIFLISLWGINALVALERYLIFKPEKSRMSPYYIVIALVAVLCIACFAIFTTSPPTADLTMPANEPQKTIYLLGMGIGSATVLSYTTYLYSATYYHVIFTLRSATKQNRAQALVEKRILKSCIWMSIGLWILYVPQIIGITMGFLEGVYAVVATQLVVFDTVFTPCLILYFMPTIRAAVVDLFSFKRTQPALLPTYDEFHLTEKK